MESCCTVAKVIVGRGYRHDSDASRADVALSLNHGRGEDLSSSTVNVMVVNDAMVEGFTSEVSMSVFELELAIGPSH